LEEGNQFDGGLGVTWIDGQSYTTFTLRPDFSFGKFGLGLNIQLLFDNSNGFEFRKAGWEGGAGILRAIRYLRYGYKKEPVYVRIGTLDATTLGHGFIMWYYSNESTYDDRKIGLELDLDFGEFGFESMTSNLGNIEILGGRAYYRPLLSTGIPIIENLETGVTFVSDFDPDEQSKTEDSITEWGLDVGLPLVQSKVFNSTIYYDFAKINNFGSGNVIGIDLNFPGLLGLMSIATRLEKRFMGEKFLPNYFNALYEIDRSFDKRTQLNAVGNTEGIFGQLAGNIAGVITIIGNYQRLNGIKNSGLLHFEARMPDLIPSIRLLAAYDKAAIETFDDVFTLDNRSLATAEIAYQAYPFMYVGMMYRWTFTYDEATDSYKPQERVEPRVSFQFNF